MTSYTPARAVELSGFSLDTLRYYEKIGLLSNVGRNAAGRRVYTEDHLGWLHMLRCLRDTGMPLAEMLRYAELCRAGAHTAAERIVLLREHDRRVEERMELARQQRLHIQWKIQVYEEVAVPVCSVATASP